MEEGNRRIVNISIENLYPHPDNPRKDIGDIEEMAKSVQKNGIMQNLTIIPISALTEEPDKQPTADKISPLSHFRVLIGHRRLAAAKKAGLKEVPCTIISNISRKEQLAIMLEENMQRSDLTIYEQAQGFQMMLDLGDSVEDIVEKTGFSQSTVYHRLNIAKLDKDYLKKVTEDEKHQLSLKELYQLEKIKNIETRNKILESVAKGSGFEWQVRHAIEEEELQEAKDRVVKILEDNGVTREPKNWDKDIYYWKETEKVASYSFYGDCPTVDEEELKANVSLYYIETNYYIYVVKKKEMDVTETEEERDAREKREEKERRQNEISDRLDNIEQNIHSFVDGLLSGDISRPQDEQYYVERLWKHMVHQGEGIDFEDMVEDALDRILTNVPDDDEYEAVKEKFINETDMFTYMLLLTDMFSCTTDVWNKWSGYRKETAKGFNKWVDILKDMGFSQSEEEQQLLDGTSELYMEVI